MFYIENRACTNCDLFAGKISTRIPLHYRLWIRESFEIDIVDIMIFHNTLIDMHRRDGLQQASFVV